MEETAQLVPPASDNEENVDSPRPGNAENVPDEGQTAPIDFAQLATEYLSVVNGAMVQAIPFDELVVLLRRPNVVAAASRCLRPVFAACLRVNSLAVENYADPARINPRVFLSAYMVAYHPTSVFEQIGALEQAVLDASGPMLRTFEDICQRLREGAAFDDLPNVLTLAFADMLMSYIRHFQAWKVPDEARLVTRIRLALLALYQAQEHISDDVPLDAELRLNFLNQIQRLRTKLFQLGAENVVEELDRELAGRPHGPDNLAPIYNLPGMINHERLAHELLLNPNFQLRAVGDLDSLHRIRNSFQDGFWRSVAEDLLSIPPVYNRVLRVLREINDGVDEFRGPAPLQRNIGIIAPGSDEVENLVVPPSDENNPARGIVVDFDALLLQLANGAFGWDDCKGLVGGFVETIAALEPAGEQEVLAQWAEVSLAMDSATPEEQPATLCRALQFLMDRITIMRIESANQRLRTIAPVVTNHGVEYERYKFQDSLDRGAITLERTTEWLRGVTELGVDRLAEAMLALTRGPPIQELTCPETLRLDAEHLADLQTWIASAGERERIEAALLAIVAGREPEWDEALLAMVARVDEMGGLLRSMARHNYEVHSATYGRILRGEA